MCQTRHLASRGIGTMITGGELMALRRVEQRDSAADLAEQSNRKSPSARMTAATRAGVSAERPSRGLVDAPGKRHRKPQPKEPIDKRMGEPRGKQMGQKSDKNGRRGLR
jgi:hypothetical protein